MAETCELIRQYFDGILCPVCRGHTLREQRFEIIDNTRKGIHTAGLAYCDHQIVVGMVIEQGGSVYWGERPAWFFFKHSNFWCPECLSEPDREDRFQNRYGLQGESWVDFDCACGFKSVIRVLPRQLGVHQPPQVLPPDDRAPEMAEYAGRVEDEDVFFAHNNPDSVDQFVHQLYLGFKAGVIRKKSFHQLALPERAST